MPRLRDRKPVDYTDYLSPTPLKKSYPIHPDASKNDDVGEMNGVSSNNPTRKSTSKKRPREQSDDIIRSSEKSKSTQSVPVKREKPAKKRKKKNVQENDAINPTNKETNGVAAKKKMQTQEKTPGEMIGRKREKRKDEDNNIQNERLLNGGGQLVASRPTENLDGIHDVDMRESVESLREKYQALKKMRDLESEKLLEDAKRLAEEERKTYEKMVRDLRKQMQHLTEQLDSTRISHRKALSAAQQKYDKRMEKAERDIYNLSTENHKLRDKVEELQSELKRANKHPKESTQMMDSHPNSSQLTLQTRADQLEKLLQVYRLMSCLEIRLIDSRLSDESSKASSTTEIACVVSDTKSDSQFVFELAIPKEEDKDIEYFPNETQANGVSPAAYLQDDLTFHRRELSRFMRSVLDVVIKSKPDASKPSRSR